MSRGPGGLIFPPARSGGRPARRPQIDLPVPDPAIGGEASAIDEDGTIVGHYFDPGLTGREHAFVWRPDGTGSRLPLPADTTSPSRALYVENGWIIGYASTPDEELVDVRWHLDE